MTVGIGLIGCGRISGNHFEAIRQQPGARIVACCDIIPERARQAAEKYDIPFWTTDYRQMLQRPEVDLVSVCTPSGLHPEHGILAARAGKHVIVEKPMAVRLADADRLIQECERAGVKLFVVLQNRLNPAIQLVRRAFEEGRFGRLYMIVANVFWTRPQGYYDMAPWRGTWALDGGAFMNQASHYVDMVQWFGGEVAEVKAITGTLARNIEAEDTGCAIVRFTSGAIASINVTMLTYPKNLEGSITLLGETGTVRVGGTAMNRIEHWEMADAEDLRELVGQAATNPPDVYGFGHRDFYSAVIDAGRLRGWAVTGEEGRCSLALLTQIYGAVPAATN
ncbi:MAG: Gfo/Idh/MocA family oxidoreductase [Syntrophomonadaceae bacterium]|nr:Gfo/Idh/MocA family oxidoreductase [Syntrophomonadaceae bacterium]MDH7498364.1 Gfo/Idh/MocA family oxidoreductase [Syntrophomonadaceae bacterium]